MIEPPWKALLDRTREDRIPDGQEHFPSPPTENSSPDTVAGLSDLPPEIASILAPWAGTTMPGFSLPPATGSDEDALAFEESLSEAFAYAGEGADFTTLAGCAVLSETIAVRLLPGIVAHIRDHAPEGRPSTPGALRGSRRIDLDPPAPTGLGLISGGLQFLGDVLQSRLAVMAWLVPPTWAGDIDPAHVIDGYRAACATAIDYQDDSLSKEVGDLSDCADCPPVREFTSSMAFQAAKNHVSPDLTEFAASVAVSPGCTATEWLIVQVADTGWSGYAGHAQREANPNSLGLYALTRFVNDAYDVYSDTETGEWSNSARVHRNADCTDPDRCYEQTVAMWLRRGFASRNAGHVRMLNCVNIAYASFLERCGYPARNAQALTELLTNPADMHRAVERALSEMSRIRTEDSGPVWDSMESTVGRWLRGEPCPKADRSIPATGRRPSPTRWAIELAQNIARRTDVTGHTDLLATLADAAVEVLLTHGCEDGGLAREAVRRWLTSYWGSPAGPGTPDMTGPYGGDVPVMLDELASLMLRMTPITEFRTPGATAAEALCYMTLMCTPATFGQGHFEVAR
ncbi:hypothetical protein AB0D49_29605 [Streptomyces sp. NPDC048290]|uniref:hypothetical protein n=1 Tax=Streptomyces sp. NPDC048290 TaxID=3155811 RepID=UPI0034144110